ncbi:hypothetical protein Tco_0767757 [Tanacetum coccineum]
MAPVWVKFHNVHIGGFLEVGMSLIASKLGKPIMMDAYTSYLCLNPWGRNSYAWVLIEISSDCKFVKSRIVAIPFEDGTGHSLESLKVKEVCSARHIEGVRLSKSKFNFVLRLVNKDGNNEAGKKEDTPVVGDKSVDSIHALGKNDDFGSVRGGEATAKPQESILCK